MYERYEIFIHELRTKYMLYVYFLYTWRSQLIKIYISMYLPRDTTVVRIFSVLYVCTDKGEWYWIFFLKVVELIHIMNLLESVEYEKYLRKFHFRDRDMFNVSEAISIPQMWQLTMSQHRMRYLYRTFRELYLKILMACYLNNVFFMVENITFHFFSDWSIGSIQNKKMASWIYY